MLSLGSDHHEAGQLMEVLLLFLSHNSLSAQTVTKLIDCIDDVSTRHRDVFLEKEGIRKLWRFMLTYTSGSIVDTCDEELRLRCCRLFDALPPGVISQNLSAHSPLVPKLLQCYISTGVRGAIYTLSIVENISVIMDIRYMLTSIRLCDFLNNLLAIALNNPFICQRTIVAILAILQLTTLPCPDVLDQALAGIVQLLHHYMHHSGSLRMLNVDNGEKQASNTMALLRNIHRLGKMEMLATRFNHDFPTGFFSVLCFAALQELIDCTFLTLLCDTAFGESAVVEPGFFEFYVRAVCIHYEGLKLQHLCGDALRIAQRMSSHPMLVAAISPAALVNLSRLPPDEFSAIRVEIACTSMRTYDIVVHFDEFVTLAQSEEPPSDSLDDVICSHFEAIMKDPHLILQNVRLVGTPLSSSLLFHTIHLLFRRSTRFPKLDKALRSFLIEQVALHKEHYHYCCQISRDFDLNLTLEEHFQPVFRAECPITMQCMHMPVVASDGNTYEAAAIIQHLHQQHRSPLTREELSDLIVYNRCVTATIRSACFLKSN